MSVAPGTRFGPYEIAEPIGQGGMGEVYRARDANLKRDVAIKVLPENFANDADRVARFQREAEVLAALNHPNIAQIYGLEKADGRTAIVMELIEGPTLADRIAEGPIPADEALGVARQILGALEAAHARQIVHRDLKPANVKVKADGTVRVLDFGIAKALEANAISGGAAPLMTTPAVTQTGVILGTAAYMSPEQARGQLIDQRADIWAFGCLLFEMLTGQAAFMGEDVMATLARVIDRETDLSSVPGAISPAVRHTIKLCLKKDPRKRIADIRDVRLALDGVFESELPRGVAGVGTQTPSRRVLPLALGILAAVMAAGVTGWYLKPAPELAPQRVTRFAHMLPDGGSFTSSGGPLVAVSPDGNAIAYSLDEALYVRSAGELEARLITPTAGQRPSSLVFSPDGEWIAYRSDSDQRIYKVALSGGSPIALTDPLVGGPRSPSWQRDDTILIALLDRGVLELPSGGGEPRALAGEFAGDEGHPSLLPGGTRLLFARVDSQEIIVRELATGEDTVVVRGGVKPRYLATGHLVYFDGGSLLVRAFDPETLISGGAVPLVDGVMRAGAEASPQFEVSASGTLVYIPGPSSDEGFGLQLALIDGSGTIVSLEVPARDYSAPAVSPDGTKLAVQVDSDAGSDIYLYEFSSQSEMRQLTYGGSSAQPAWKDNETLSFASDREGSRTIWEQRIDGGTALQLTMPEDGFDHVLPAWTPDGRLAYTRQASGGTTNADIYVQSVPAGVPGPLIDSEGRKAGVAFSADGRAMAYMAVSPTSLAQIFVSPYPPDGSLTRVSAEGEVGLWPFWSREGFRVIYQNPNTRELKTVDISVPGFAPSNRVTIGNFPGAAPVDAGDSLPGGRYVMLWQPGATDGGAALADRIVVIENWIEEIKARVPPL